MLFWYTIPAVAAVLGGSAVFAFSRTLRRFHKFMGFTLIFEGLMFMLAGTVFTKSASFFAPTYILYVTTLLLNPFFYYLATLHLLSEKGAEVKDCWMLEIAAVFVLVLAALLPSIGQSEREGFFSVVTGLDLSASGTGVSVLLTMDTLAYMLFLAEQLFIQAFCAVNVLRYRRLLEDYYSSLENKSLSAVACVLVMMFLRFVVLVCMSIFDQTSVPVWLAVAQVSVSVLFYLAVSMSVCRISHTAEELGKMLEDRASRARIPAADEFIESRMSRLLEDKFYLDPDVDLAGLSSAIGVNTRYVSDFIRYHFSESFMAYVNRLRVEHSKTLLGNPSIPVNEISEQSGFISQSTFYRNFTKIMGISPSQYRESVCKS